MQLFEKKGEGRAGPGLGSERLGAGQRSSPRPREGQGAGRRQGAGAGHRGQSILRFSRAENLKKGNGGREGQGAGQAGRRQGAGAGHNFEGEGRAGQGLGSERLGAGLQGQGTEGLQDFHFEVFKA